MKKGFLFIICFVLFSHSVLGATVYGDIYDFSLEKVNKARITVNTTPEQHFISKEGSYSFDIPNGFYEITVTAVEEGNIIASETRNVTVKQSGSYVIDFILFPNLDDINELEDDIGITIPDQDENGLIPYLYFGLVFLLLILYIAYRVRKKSKNKGDEHDDESIASSSLDEKKEYDDDLEQVLAIIKKEGGRTTQKEIRKHIPLSEAKISLMITELEDKGVVRKIKKGRGNVIVLVDK